jgi:hypothetical protein
MWYENLLLLPFSLVVVIYLVTIAPIIMLIGFINDNCQFKKSGLTPAEADLLHSG